MKKLIILMTLTLSLQGFAGVLVEPYMGYGITGFEATDTGSSSAVEFAVDGQSVGGRLGITMFGFFAALDYEMGSRDFELDSGTSSQTLVEKDVKNQGIAIGWDVPILPIRFWGKYIFSSEWEEGPTLWEGKASAIGVGFTMLPIIDINIEVKKYTLDSGTGSLGEVTGQEVFIGLSAPFDVF